MYTVLFICGAEAEFHQQRLRSLQGLRVPLATAILLPVAIALRLQRCHGPGEPDLG